MLVLACKICCHYLIARIYIILLCSWSYGVLLWEMETGGVQYLFLTFFFNRLFITQVRMSFQSYVMLIFLSFFFFGFAFFFSYFYNQASNHILVWQPRNWCQSWGKATDWKSPTDVQMKCKIYILLFVHSFIYSNVYIMYLIIYSSICLTIWLLYTVKPEEKKKHAIGGQWTRNLILEKTEKKEEKLALIKKVT